MLSCNVGFGVMLTDEFGNVRRDLPESLNAFAERMQDWLEADGDGDDDFALPEGYEGLATASPDEMMVTESGADGDVLLLGVWLKTRLMHDVAEVATWPERYAALVTRLPLDVQSALAAWEELPRVHVLMGRY